MPDPFYSGPSWRPVTIINSDGVFDSTGSVKVQPGTWPQTYNYNADGTLNYEEITDGTSTWRRTYTYVGGQVTAITAWVKQ